jgi:hypothetical protein
MHPNITVCPQPVEACPERVLQAASPGDRPFLRRRPRRKSVLRHAQNEQALDIAGW